MLTINEIDCFYNSTRALQKVRLKVKDGDFLGILGPNGSGKTTLLRSISKSLRPTAGHILLDGIDIQSLTAREVARNVGVVPQETNVIYDLTSLDIVLMGRNPYLRRFSIESVRDLEIAKEAMGLTRTWHLANRYINELSAGEKQRVVIARAIAQHPKILLLDEPTSHLDLNHQIEIMDLLHRLSQESGLAVLAVFHDVNLAIRYCNSVVLLKEGKVLAAGLTAETLTEENLENVFEVKIRRIDSAGGPFFIPHDLVRAG